MTEPAPDAADEQAFRDLHGIPDDPDPVETITPPEEYL